MDLTKVLAQLHAELNYLNAAIASLQRLQQGDLEGREAPEKRNRIPAEMKPAAPKTERRRPRCLENLQTAQLAMPSRVDVGPNEASKRVD